MKIPKTQMEKFIATSNWMLSEEISRFKINTLEIRKELTSLNKLTADELSLSSQILRIIDQEMEYAENKDVCTQLKVYGALYTYCLIALKEKVI